MGQPTSYHVMDGFAVTIYRNEDNFGCHSHIYVASMLQHLCPVIVSRY